MNTGETLSHIPAEGTSSNEAPDKQVQSDTLSDWEGSVYAQLSSKMPNDDLLMGL